MPAGFTPPPWAASPTYAASCEVLINGEPEENVNIGDKAFYIFGRDANTCDFSFDDKSVSRIHAAMVHSKDGCLYLIDLSSTHGSTVGTSKIAPKKPTALRNGVVVKFGQASKTYKLELPESMGDGKRKAVGDAGGGEKDAKRGRPDPAGGGGETVSCRHILIKHRDSRKPKNWREPEGATRTKEEAEEIVLQFRREIEEGGATFEELASESHCSSYRRGGDLGAFPRGKMQKPFEEAAFALAVGELSHPVFSDSGVHIILRYA